MEKSSRNLEVQRILRSKSISISKLFGCKKNQGLEIKNVSNSIKTELYVNLCINETLSIFLFDVSRQSGISSVEH